MERLLRTAARKSPRLAGFERAFQQERRELLVERARFLLKICLVVYPAFWGLDLIVAPELAGRVLQIRISICLLYLLSPAAAYPPRAGRAARARRAGFCPPVSRSVSSPCSPWLPCIPLAPRAWSSRWWWPPPLSRPRASPSCPPNWVGLPATTSPAT